MYYPCQHSLHVPADCPSLYPVHLAHDPTASSSFAAADTARLAKKAAHLAILSAIPSALYSSITTAPAYLAAAYSGSALSTTGDYLADTHRSGHTLDTESHHVNKRTRPDLGFDIGSPHLFASQGFRRRDRSRLFVWLRGGFDGVLHRRLQRLWWTILRGRR